MGPLLLALVLFLPALLLISTYTIATRTQTFTLASVALLKSLLRRHNVITEVDGSVVEPCSGGLLLTNVSLHSQLLQLFAGSVTVPTITVKRLHLLWPTSSSPLTIHVSGVAVRLLQRMTAPKVDVNTKPFQRNKGKLKALDSFVWHGVAQGGLAGLWLGQGRVLRFLIAVALRNVYVSVADVDVRYTQTGDPAAELKGAEKGTVDAVAITIRTADVSPVRSQPSRVLQRQQQPQSPGVGGVSSDGNERKNDVANDAKAPNDAHGTLSEPPPDMQHQLYRWWRMHVRVPWPSVRWLMVLSKWMFRKGVQKQQLTRYRNASRVSVSGVTIILLSKSPESAQYRTFTGQQRPHPRADLPQVYGPRKRRVHAVGTAGIFGVGTPPSAAADELSADALSYVEPCWSSISVVLRQWSMQVDVSLTDPNADASCLIDRAVPAAPRALSPVAVQIHGFFGIHRAQRRFETSPVKGAQAAAQAGGTGADASNSSAAASTEATHGAEPLPGTGTARTVPVVQKSSSTAAVQVNIALKALLPELTPESTVQLLRMVGRIATYEKYKKHWSRRPALSVSQSPVAWWQHAGQAVIDDCREHYPVRDVTKILARRTEYIETYRAVRSVQHGFIRRTRLPEYEQLIKEKQDKSQSGYSAGHQTIPVGTTATAACGTSTGPDNRGPGEATGAGASAGAGEAHARQLPRRTHKYRRRVTGTAAELQLRLAQLEAQLPLGQIMCYRAFVALWHSAYLARHHDVKQRWMAAFNIITNFVDAIPTADAEEDEEPADMDADGVADGRGDDAVGRSTAALSAISLSITCPRLGVKLLHQHVSAVTYASIDNGWPRTAREAATSEGKARGAADVLALVLEGIRFTMPTKHHLLLQASTIKATQLGSSIRESKPILVVPAPRETIIAHGMKLDCSEPSNGGDSPSTASGTGWSRPSTSMGAIYPDAPISSYLSRFKMFVAPVEVGLVSPRAILACARYIERMSHLTASARAATANGGAWPSTSLHSLVIDSYKLNSVPLPSSMAAFAPKLQVYCPMVIARWLLQPEFTPSVGGVSAQQSEMLFVAVLTCLRFSSRYVHTCYGALLHTSSAQAHAEACFHISPRPGQPARRTSRETGASGPAAASGSQSAATGGISRDAVQPQYGSFCKLWLHPDDVDVDLSSVSPGPGSPTQTTRRSNCLPRGAPNARSGGSVIPAPPGFSGGADASLPPPSFPFVPLVKIRSACILAMKQLPHEPAVPGTLTKHHTVGVHSVLVWFSPWQAKLIGAAIDQLLEDSLLALLRRKRDDGLVPAGSGVSSAGAGDTNAAATRASVDGCSEASAEQTGQPPGGVSSLLQTKAGSSISVLVDIPLLAVNLHAEMPDVPDTQEGVRQDEDALRNGADLQSAAWVKNVLQGPSNPSDGRAPAEDAVLRWGLRITPLLTLNVTHVRAGIRLTKKSDVHAAMQTTGVQVSDHQSRLKRATYQKVWLPNAGCASSGLASLASGAQQGLLPECFQDQLLGPTAIRAEAVRNFARDRRRAALGLSLRAAPSMERMGKARQLWRRLLEVQQLQRASDYAIFLLTSAHRNAARLLPDAQLQPFSYYRAVYKAFYDAENERRGSETQDSSLDGEQLPESSPVLKERDLGHAPRHRSESTVSALMPSMLRRRPSWLRGNRSKSVGALCGLSNLASLVHPRAGRVGLSVSQHRKSACMAQMLEHTNTLGAAALKRGAMAIAASQASAAGLFQNRSSLSASRHGMAGISENECTPVPSLGSALNSGQPFDGEMAPGGESSFRSGCGRSFSGRGNLPSVFETASRDKESHAEASSDYLAGSLHSVFSTADAQSRFATLSSRQAGPMDADDLPGALSQSPFPSCYSGMGQHADIKLSFVGAFAYLGRVTSPSSCRTAFVHSMPLARHNMWAIFSQETSFGGQALSRMINGNCLFLFMNVGVKSLGGILRMLVQSQQAMQRQRAPPSGTAREPATPKPTIQPSAKRIPFEAHLEMYLVDLQVRIEEKPRRWLGRASQPSNGLTELTSVRLLDTLVIAKPSDAGGHTEPSDLEVELRVGDIRILDLQGCVEHRNVLVGNPSEELSGATGLGGVGQGPLGRTMNPWRSPGDVSTGCRSPCRVEVLLKVPLEPRVPLRVVVRVHDPRVTWLRRYSNNLMYAVGLVKKAYMDAMLLSKRSSEAHPPSTVRSPEHMESRSEPVGATGGGRQVESSGRLAPVIMIKVSNLGVLLPAGTAGSKGAIRRSVNNESLAFNASSLGICIPGETSALQRWQLYGNDPYSLGDLTCTEVDPFGELSWMTTEEEIADMITSSLSLGTKHFPQLDEHGSQESPSPPSSPGHAGAGTIARKPHSPAASSSSSSPKSSGRLQRHLKAARATLFDALKEILQEAGQKRNKQHGEQGLLMIEEQPMRGPTGACRAGYLSFPEEDVQPLTAAVGMHHTTTTICAQPSPGGLNSHGQGVDSASRGVGPSLGGSAQQRIKQELASPSLQPAGKCGAHAMGSGQSLDGSHVASVTSEPNSVSSRRHPPIVLFTARGLTAFSCQLVACDKDQYKGAEPPARQGSVASVSRTPGAHARQRGGAVPEAEPSEAVPPLGAGRRFASQERRPGVNDDDVEVVLRQLAEPELQSAQQLIDPAALKGVLFRHTVHGALQLHLSALEGMSATLGPRSYERMLKVLTDNIVEGSSSFQVGMVQNVNKPQRDKAFAQSIRFGPKPGEVPFFHLTVEWPDKLHATLESDPAWWSTGCQPGASIEACLQACFTQCSLGLMMTQRTNDMHLAFHSQQMHVADVRTSARTATAPKSPAYSSSATPPSRSVGSPAPHSVSNSLNSVGGGDTSMETTSYDEDEEAPEAMYNADGLSDGDSGDVYEGLNVQPVFDDQQGGSFPDKAAVVTLIRSNISLPTGEAAHLARSDEDGTDSGDGGECPRDGQHNCLRVSFAMLHGGTMANEIELCHTLVQWPYLTEMSLVSSIISIFYPVWGQPPKGLEAKLRLEAMPWFYFNLVLRDSQLYVPVLSPHLRCLESSTHASDASHSGRNLRVTADKLQELFASMMAAEGPTGYPQDFTFGDAGLQGFAVGRRESLLRGQKVQSAFRERLMYGRAQPEVLAEVQRLEHMGIALTFSALRVGHFSGGDGESILKIDMRNGAGFVRHSGAQVTNWLLPIRSLAMEYRCSMPLVEESRETQKYLLVARSVVLVFKAHRKKRNSRSLLEQSSPQVEGAPAQLRAAETGVAEDGGFDAVIGAALAGDVPPSGGDEQSIVSRNARSIDSAKPALEVLLEKANARASDLLAQHNLSLPTTSAARVVVENLLPRRPVVTSLTFRMDTAVVRGSFSNIPLWQALMDDLGLAGQLLQRNNGLFAPSPVLSRSFLVRSPAMTPRRPSAATLAKESWNFRPSSMSVDLHVTSLAFVLCDDKKESYGAPDVLAAATEQLELQYSVDKRYLDHLPEQSGCVSLRLSAQFLNNSTGRWEHLLEPWPAELHLSDPINPVFKSSRTKYVFMTSSELLKLNFHPSCLLTMGDTLAFASRLLRRVDSPASAETRQRGDVAVPIADRPPSMREQMALSGSVMSRVPQRYLIQNWTGMSLSYWVPQPEQDGRVPVAANKKILRSGCIEELQVVPAVKQVKIVGPGGVVVTRMQTQVIVLKFEGNWMPISDVSVDVVGKYCYDLHSPHEDRRAPVVVDVKLVGRTKILKVHSALYILNNTDLRMGFRLHFPTPTLARQTVLGPGDEQLPGEQDVRLRSLRPGEGRYLPVLAAMGGSLYLEPRMHGKNSVAYLPPEHDVIRLYPSVSDMHSQSGFIACGPPTDGSKGLYGGSPLHFAVKVKVKSRTDFSYTTFQAIEVPGPGLFAKASRPLEACIKITPTVSVTNSLPYRMDGYLITLSSTGKEAEAAGSRSNNPAAGRAALNGPSTKTRRSGFLEGATSTVEQSQVIEAMQDLIVLLKHKERLSDMSTLSPSEKKCLLMAMLRYELRWTCPAVERTLTADRLTARHARDMTLLMRTDSDSADKITWQELGGFVEWAKLNVRRVQVPPGATQRHYVDMHKRVILCLKIPEMKLVSRPVEISYGSGAGTVAIEDLEQLPTLMRFDRVEEDETHPAETLERVYEDMLSRCAADVKAHVKPTVPQQVHTGSKGHVKRSPRGHSETPTPIATTSDPAKAFKPDDADDSFWKHNKEKEVRVQFRVEPGPWQGRSRTVSGAGSLRRAGPEVEVAASKRPEASCSKESTPEVPPADSRINDAKGTAGLSAPAEAAYTRDMSLPAESAGGSYQKDTQEQNTPDRMVRFQDHQPSQSDRSTVPGVLDGALPKEEAAILDTEDTGVSSHTAGEVMDSTAEQHVRIRISFRPNATSSTQSVLANLHRKMDTIRKGVGTIYRRIVPELLGSRGSRHRRNHGASTSSFSSGHDKHSCPRPIIARLHVEPATGASPERVKLQLMMTEPGTQPVGSMLAAASGSSVGLGLSNPVNHPAAPVNGSPAPPVAAREGSASYGHDSQTPITLERSDVAPAARGVGVAEVIAKRGTEITLAWGSSIVAVDKPGIAQEESPLERLECPSVLTKTRSSPSQPAAISTGHADGGNGQDRTSFYLGTAASVAQADPSGSSPLITAQKSVAVLPAPGTTLSPRLTTPFSPHAADPFRPEDYLALGSTEAPCTNKSSEATPATICILRSGSNSTISVPSGSLPKRQLWQGDDLAAVQRRSEAAGPRCPPPSSSFSCLTPLMLQADGDGPDGEDATENISDSSGGNPGLPVPPVLPLMPRSPRVGARPGPACAVWSDNAAFNSCSRSDNSSSELPIRIRLSEVLPKRDGSAVEHANVAGAKLHHSVAGAGRAGGPGATRMAQTRIGRRHLHASFSERYSRMRSVPSANPGLLGVSRGLSKGGYRNISLEGLRSGHRRSTPGGLVSTSASSMADRPLLHSPHYDTLRTSSAGPGALGRRVQLRSSLRGIVFPAAICGGTEGGRVSGASGSGRRLRGMVGGHSGGLHASREFRPRGTSFVAPKSNLSPLAPASISNRLFRRTADDVLAGGIKRSPIGSDMRVPLLGKHVSVGALLQRPALGRQSGPKPESQSRDAERNQASRVPVGYRRRGSRHSMAGSSRRLAASLASAMTSVPTMARNVGEMFVDGSHQVHTQVHQVAHKVADKLIAGGHGVKDIVVGGTEQVIRAAKPKLQSSFRSLAWKVTEALRSQKQGDRAAPMGEPTKKKKTAGLAPKVLHLQLHNSLAAKEEEYSCRVSIYAPFWVDNRTGFDLMFMDLDVPPFLDSLPFLQFCTVDAPGNDPDALAPDSPYEPPAKRSIAALTTGSMQDLRTNSNLRPPGAVARRSRLPMHKPAMLNKQTRTRFRVVDGECSMTEFSAAFTVDTTNQKYSVDLKAKKVEMTEEEFNSMMCWADKSQRKAPSQGPSKPPSSYAVTVHEQPIASAPNSGNLSETCNRSSPWHSTQRIALPGLIPASEQKGGGAISPVSSPRQQPRQGTQRAGTALPAPLATDQGLGTNALINLPDIDTQPPSASTDGPPQAANLNLVEASAAPVGQRSAAGRVIPTYSSEIVPVEDEAAEGARGGERISVAQALADIPEHSPCVTVVENQTPRVGTAREVAEPAPQPTSPLPSTAPAAAVSVGPSRGASSGGGGAPSPVGLPSVPPKRGPFLFEQQPKVVSIRRMYQFAVEVWPAPNKTVFNRTKIITVKNKYLILNATGLTIEYKQKGTPDPSDAKEFGDGRRFSGKLHNNWRKAWHWDNANAEQELMIRPAGDDWEWSGSFKLPEVEDYFGLRIRHRYRRGEYVIIPVNITVGAAGTVLVTLNSKESVPPYMVVNRCRDVVVRIKQSEWAGRNPGRPSRTEDGSWEDWDVIQPNANVPMPFAWDEPRLRHTVKVVATSQRDPCPVQSNGIDVDLDAVDVNGTIYVASRHAASGARRKTTDNARKVYVTVYADGPTRVLCFSEDRTGDASMDDENSLMNLLYRLQQVAVRLRDVEHRLVQQFGGAPDEIPDAPQPAGGSQTTGPTGTLGTEDSPNTRLVAPLYRHGGAAPGAAFMGAVPPGLRHIATEMVRARTAGLLPSGPNTPGSGRGALPSIASNPSAPLRPQGTGYRGGSLHGPNLQPYSRLGSGPGLPHLSKPHHSRQPSNSSQGYGALLSPLGPSGSGLPPLLTEAPLAADEVTAHMLDAPRGHGNDVDIPDGGDLAIVFRRAEGLGAGLSSNEKLIAVEAQMVIKLSNPSLVGKKAAVNWTQVQPSDGSSRIELHNYEEVFRDIPAAAELQIDFFISKRTEQSTVGRRTGSTGGYGSANSQVITTPVARRGAQAGSQITVTTGQFAGCVRVPLLLTLGREKDQLWRLPLERKAGSQLVRGHVVVSFEWSVTSEGMLLREVETLERILAEKIELLALLNPLPPAAASAFVHVNELHWPGRLPEITDDMGAANEPPEQHSMALDLANGGTGTGLALPIPVKRTAKAMAESYSVNLELSVIEVAGLVPREGVRASIAAFLYGRQNASLMSTAMLPRAVVSMKCNGETRTALAGTNSVNPRFAKNTYIFPNVPLGAKVELQVLDQVSSAYSKKLAEAEILVSNIPGTDPIYAWLALPRRKRGSRSQKMLALLMSLEEEGEGRVKVLMRIKINKPQVHGVLAAITLDLAGVGLCAKTNLEELFNFTMQKIRASLVQTRKDLQVATAVQVIQLDNQMLEANNPVVLSPADASQSGSVAHARRRHMARLAHRTGKAGPILRLGTQEPLKDPLLSFQVIYNQASSNHAPVNTAGQKSNFGILSFKKVVVELGPMDFSADQEFIEAVIAYLHAMPLKDIDQNAARQQEQHVMQGGALGHPETGDESPLGIKWRREPTTVEALTWLFTKEKADLELMRGQSSTWFYLEEFHLSDIFINVTLALSSSFNAAGAGGLFAGASSSRVDDERHRSMLRGFLSRVAGSSGFQLINVTNVPIQLEFVELRNHLVNRVSLVNKLSRHYTWLAIAQARKVLGGAGPAIAAIPASLLWASLAFVDLGQDVAAKRLNIVKVPMRIGNIAFTLTGQVIGVMSQAMCAMMGVLPPRFSTDTNMLSDSDTARRFGVKPQTIMDAIYLAQRDVMFGFISAAFGLVHDTAAGARWKGSLAALGLPVGLAKATLGLAVRPAAGTIEAASKVFQGVGLLCLGKRGIQGKLVRRVQAPGLAVTDVVQAARASVAHEAMQTALIAAWQDALPSISSSLMDDEVVEVVAARPTRVVLLTNQHLAYICARRHSSGSSSTSGAGVGSLSVSYRVKWIIRNDHIDNIRGLDRGFAVSVEYHKPVRLGRMSLKLPLRKGMRTSTAEGHKDLIFRLNRHIGHSAGQAAARKFNSVLAAVTGSADTAGADVQDLRITQPHSGNVAAAAAVSGTIKRGSQEST